MKQAILGLLWVYQKMVSPWLGSNCRFYPSCSEWSREAVEKYGALKGSLLSLKRLLSCQPFNPGGYAPLNHG